MRSKLLATLCVITTGACVPNSQMAVLQSRGGVRVERTPTLAYDYTVTVRNVREDGYDAERRDDREGLALSAIRGQCPGAKVVGEKVTRASGKPAHRSPDQFTIKVFCPPA